MQDNGVDLHDFTSRRNAKKYLMSILGYTKQLEVEPQEEDYEKAMATPITDTISLDDLYRAKDELDKTSCPVAVPCQAVNWVKRKNYPVAQEPNKKENNMGFEQNIEVDQRNHLKRRLDNVQREHYSVARKAYHMKGLDVTGLTKDEALALITSSIKLRDGAFNSEGKVSPYYDVFSAFELIDAKMDQKGFDAAIKAIDTAYTAAKDTILVLPLAEGLKALQAYEAATF
jgi:hypothetical protein